MSKAGNWFSGLSKGGKVGAILGGVFGTLFTLSVVGAAVSPPQTETPAVNTPISNGIQADQVEKKTVTETEPIAFKTVTEEDAYMDKGESAVTQEGVKGTLTITYEVTYTNGQETDRKKIKKEITKKPVNKIVTKGTYEEPRESGSCDPNYTGGCVPLVSYDLDCPDIGFSVYVVGSDPHRFDADDDGYGCESY